MESLATPLFLQVVKKRGMGRVWRRPCLTEESDKSRGEVARKKSTWNIAKSRAQNRAGATQEKHMELGTEQTMEQCRHTQEQNFVESLPVSCKKNQGSLPSSFQAFPNCRMVIDCTDIKIAAPSSMDLQKYTYSTYRGMHTFKVLIGVAPNAVITYCSKLYPGSVSDKSIVSNCGILEIFKSGDTILADKGFLISDMLPQGVTLNIPPFYITANLLRLKSNTPRSLLAQECMLNGQMLV
uniref:DDE Tnp4 domain-containing protein n=1 Tax=Neogobius melanostomus TaxID=47308 RepID=A0A8C6U6Q7_9GOBI